MVRATGTRMGLLLPIILALAIGSSAAGISSNDPCYFEGKPRKCLPSFVNAAYGNPVQASSVCGAQQPERYCELLRDGNAGECRSCEQQRYGPAALTDLNNPSNVTCWRSGAVNVPHDPDSAPPDNVTLTLSLGKKYELTYISLSFCPRSPRPDSLAIFKSSDFGQTWQPFQFYSSQCQKFYGRPDRAKISKFNEQEARCINSQHDTGGAAQRFAFNTLEGRPSANDLDSSLVLQDWVTATDIRVVFHRLELPPQLLKVKNANAFSDEMGGSREEDEDDDADLELDGEQDEYDYNLQDNDSADAGYDEYEEPKKHLELDDDHLHLDYASDGESVVKRQGKHKGSAYEKHYQSKLAATTPPQQPPKVTPPGKVTPPSTAAPSAAASAVTLPISQHYAVSDFAVGGRCKCNGHASECVATVSSGSGTALSDQDDGQDEDTPSAPSLANHFGRSTQMSAKLTMTCACKHNTAGPECERCKPFYFDRPWGRATDNDANECKMCQCNGHARRCRFNLELYKLSGRVSGGVCYNCQHDTTGRYCHYCREGYYRDATKPPNHRKVCKRCDCHPVGSTGKTCNHLSGQCPCKEGVTGLTCNRCARGYQQTRSHVAPCIKVPTNANMIQAESAGGGGGGGTGDYKDGGGSQVEEMKKYCGKCKASPKKLNLNKFCMEDYAILAKVIGHDRASQDISTEKFSIERQNEIYKYEINIQTIFKRNPMSGTTSSLLGRGNMMLLVPRKSIECQCPKIKLNKSYLILGRDSEAAPGYLAIGPSSVVLEWKDEWSLRMKRFQRRARKCS
uniref:Netrin-B n=3 Tax=Drosophila melanogaster TaxID=7227 RepID=NETB_DROME|nr:Netrin-B, isoform B [Drosophila melanogaster]NP_001162754.1 Netrin-B, isoform C [Drosophila melanogaster]NP_001162755.1 Netrin-B, isoform D [Drosophila melanogaster]NP_001245668.1 Netrin-B, isoform E [Drosophila melanogaster]NP_001245669.1 Netrin-B, isoform F [Drosophila melanogaster]NP_511155.1 Netrin-B, isoform A [Drosophila melanogaster]Q24568.1 RecName: Full=Netrin-B; Flags: Precursor [Drosophila melanogaster]AAB17534.1 Netrin-B [Drosophila melanogaster]AAB17548.1 secreted axon guida|eukprot:NP_001162753.1 Netrin-B, isoform B [Drosophila melanogaster]